MPVMQNSYPSLNAMLLTLPLIHTSLLYVLPKISTPQWEKAAASIIHRYIEFIYDAHIICEETCVSNEFLKKIPVPIQNSLPVSLHEESLILVIAQSGLFVKSFLEIAANSTRNKFVILVECDKCSVLEEILIQCWKHRILNVVLIPIVIHVLPIYTYFPFREGVCFDSSPVLIDNFTDAFILNVDLFPRKVWNLRNCTLLVSSFDLYPVIYFEHMEMKGLYSSVFYAVAKSMNFNPLYVLTDELFGVASGPNKTGLRGDVYSGRAHLGFMLLSPLDFDYLDYDSLAMTGCLTWCCPGSFKAKPLLWLIVGEFTPAVWLMLVVSAAGTVATEFVIRKFSPRSWSKRTDDMYMKVWATLLQGSGEMPRYSTLTMSAFWISWLLLSVVVSTAYLSTMKSFQTAPYIEYSVNSLEELADAGLQAWYHKGYAPIMNAISETNTAVKKLKSKSFVFSPDMYGTMISLLPHKNITSLLSSNLCQIYSELYVNEFALFPVPDACMLMSSWHMFVMKKKSVFTEAVTSLMGRLTQAGIVQRTWSGNNTLPRSFIIRQKSLSLEAMLPSFLVLACGLLVSFVALLFERLLMYYSLS